MADSRGYYAALGVAPNATAAEIKAAFRTLAKETHPDRSGQSDAGAGFRKINEAYRTLGDTRLRAEYDRASAAPRSEGQLLAPLRCSKCDRVTAQPRYVIFRNVVSVILVTMRNPTHGIYCAACARGLALRATAISALVGWWGVPWGPVYTVWEGFRNGLGGENLADAEDELLWHNALAFAQRGDHALAAALAQRVRNSSNRDVSQSAEQLLVLLGHEGCTTSNRSDLKNPWRFSLGHFGANVGMVAAVPLLAYALIAAAPESGRTASSETYAAAPSASSLSDIDPQASASGATAASPLPSCAHAPPNGAHLAGRRFRGAGHRLEIANGSEGDAIIKLRNASTGRMVTSLFVRRGETAALQGIPDGTYSIQYAFGPSLRQDCKSFTTIQSAGQFPETETLSTERRPEAGGTRVIRQRLSYTLYSVPFGNVQPMSLDPASFAQD